MRKLVTLDFMLSTVLSPLVWNAQQQIPNSVACAAAGPLVHHHHTRLPFPFTPASRHTSPSPLLCLPELYL